MLTSRPIPARRGAESDARTWVVGGAWDNGPWHAGLSFYRLDLDSNAYGAGFGDDLQIDRWTLGGGYTYGPGMTFRGSAAMLNTDTGGRSGLRSVPGRIGTDVNF